MMANVWAVIRREYLQRVRSRWFIFTTIAGPLMMAGLIYVPAYFGQRQQRNQRTLAVVDRTGVLFARLAPILEEAEYTLSDEPDTAGAVETLSQRVIDGDLGGLIVLDGETLRSGEAVLYATSRPSAIRRISIQSAVARASLQAQLADQGVDTDALISGGELRVEMLTGSPGGMQEPRVAMAFVGAFLLYMVILLYSVAVMRATLEEKTNRIVEIVISSMKPWHLMLGKIMGVGAVGVTQMAVWAASAFVLASAALPAVLAANPELASLRDIGSAMPTAWQLLLLLGFWIFGYFIYSGMYAAVGAMCNTDEEAQQAQLPVVMLVVAPAILIAPVLESPNSAMAVSLSLVPFFSPILMWARAAAGAAPWWQVTLSFGLMAITVLAVAWVAGRIYRVGILMAGKRPTLPELWRWVREA